jgi:hypothetical protein
MPPFNTPGWVFSCLGMPSFCVWAYLSSCYVTVRSFEPLEILNAICLHMVSQMFLSIVVNRALYAPSCK